MHSLLQFAAMSLKRKAGAEGDGDGLESHVECPICMACPILPPIRQCPNGHTLCDGCSEKVDACPTCRAQPVNIRNRAAESMLAGVKVRCPYAPHCTFKPLYGEVAKHQEECQHRPIKCPALNCCDLGAMAMDPPAIVQHLVDKHRATRATIRKQKADEVEAVMIFENPLGLGVANWDPVLITAFSEEFIIQFQASQTGDRSSYAVCLQHVTGSLTKFHYEVSVTGYSRTLLFRSPTRSLRDPPDVVFGSQNCLRVERHLAHFMSDKDKQELKLQFKFLIRRAAF